MSAAPRLEIVPPHGAPPASSPRERHLGNRVSGLAFVHLPLVRASVKGRGQGFFVPPAGLRRRPVSGE